MYVLSKGRGRLLSPPEDVLSLPVTRKFSGEAQKQELNRLVLQKAPSLKARKFGTGQGWCHTDLRPPSSIPPPHTENRSYRFIRAHPQDRNMRKGESRRQLKAERCSPDPCGHHLLKTRVSSCQLVKQVWKTKVKTLEVIHSIELILSWETAGAEHLPTTPGPRFNPQHASACDTHVCTQQRTHFKDRKPRLQEDNDLPKVTEQGVTKPEGKGKSGFPDS